MSGWHELVIFDSMNHKEKYQFIKNNLHLTNVELGQIFGIKAGSIEKYLSRKGLKRSRKIVLDMQREGAKKGGIEVHKKYDFGGENNPNWKGGISQDYYRYKKLQVQRYPDRIKARNKVRYAIKVGKLQRKPCETCGEAPSFAHHENYGKPLDVNWFCRKHHQEKHRSKH